MLRFFRIERPTTTTFRPHSTATSAACCMRWMFEANEATRIFPCAEREDRAECLADEPLGAGVPGRSAFVESPSRRSTPRFPIAARAPTSVCRPSTGVWSSFQSPVWTTRPAGRLDDERGRVGDRVRDADELDAERAELERGISRLRRDELRLRPSPCSSSFDLTSARVSGVATTQHVDLAQEVRQAADVILVAVREHDRPDRAADTR